MGRPRGGELCRPPSTVRRSVSGEGGGAASWPSHQSLFGLLWLFGGRRWETAREDLVTRLMEGRAWPVINGAEQALVLTGLTVTADWIASGDMFDDPEADWRPLVEQAVDAAGFRPPRVRERLGFGDIFPFAPNPVQQAFLDQVTGPGEYILEAPMGLGKTEAALYAAYRLLEKGQAGGVYFALPTQLTSNKIHDRVNAFLERILENGAEAGTRSADAWQCLVETLSGTRHGGGCLARRRVV